MTQDLNVRSVRKARPHVLAAVLILLSVVAFGQTKSDPWLILTNGEKGAINARTTREDLKRLYGDTNVVDQNMYVDEGDPETGTVLFPNDPERRIEILWRDYAEEANPREVTISGKVSRWHTVHGISLGTTYSELARINGRPFPINWGTDQGSVVLSWNGGALEKALRDTGIVFIWFNDAPSSRTTQNGTSRKRRNRPNAMKGNQGRRVNQMTWKFPYQVPQ